MISAENLREMRIARAMSQEKLGALIGATGQYICALEHGRQPDIRSSTLRKLAEVLDCSTDYLLGRHQKVRAA
jgi:DNA-binding Xre family transcriptional regulator